MRDKTNPLGALTLDEWRAELTGDTLMVLHISKRFLRAGWPDLAARIESSPADSRRRPPIPNGMNLTERRYAEGLEARRLFGEIREWFFEPDTLPLGPEMTFKPDFRVEHLNNTVEYVDVKGRHMWEDATVKIKAAAVLYPEFLFVQAKWTGRRRASRLSS
jgi:hypothetical protein